MAISRYPRVSRAEHNASLVEFEALVHPHLPSLLAFARRRLRCDSDADDVVQNALVRAWSGFNALRDYASARAWLYQVVRSAIADHARTAARRQSLVSITSLDDAHAVLLDDEPTALEAAIARASAEQVQKALASLPTEFAVAVQLHDMDGLLYREIADLLDIPVGTVMSRISRGRRHLAVLLCREKSAMADEHVGSVDSARSARGGSMGPAR